MEEDQFNSEQDSAGSSNAEQKPNANPEDAAGRFRRLTESDQKPNLEDFDPSNLAMDDEVSSSLESTLSMAGLSTPPKQPQATDLTEAPPPSQEGESGSNLDLPDDTQVMRGESAGNADKTISHAEHQKQSQLPPDIVPPPSLGNTPVGPPPRIDKDGMPRPGNVLETDLAATQVSDSAFVPPIDRPRVQQSQGNKQSGTSQQMRRPQSDSRSQQANRTKQTGPSRASGNRRPQQSRGTGPQRVQNVGSGGKGQPQPPRKRRSLGCFIQSILAVIALLIVTGAGAATWGLFKYRSIVKDLPSVADLQATASKFETTRILDRDGNNLYEIFDPTAGRRTYVHLEDISPFMLAAIIGVEDSQFYNHPGVNYWAIVRAFYQNFTSGEVVSGASTITQQLARLLLLKDEVYIQTYDRKLREALLAIEITRQYSKDDILELYLNEVYFGNLAYGVEAASEIYFNTTAKQLNLEQASFLAGLPQAPSVYDVYTNPELTFGRQQDVLRLMYQASEAQGCIYVSVEPLHVCVTLDEAAAAAFALQDYEFPKPDVEIKFPHWVTYVRTLLEEQFDPQTIYHSGFIVETTLDPTLQDMAQAAVVKHVSNLAANNVQSGALVAVIPGTGEIVAMVGSADFFNDDIDGQINMAINPRQPGSSIKPFTYLAAFEAGWTPATIIWDVESEFPPSGDPNDTREPYVPVNYDERFHGPVSVRTAIANSFNIPAVKALNFVGIFSEGGLVKMAEKLGISTLTRNDYGLSLTLGGGEVTLLDMTNAYATIANEGVYIPTVAILRITDSQGNVVFEYEPPVGEQVISQDHAFLMSDILSDNAARTPSFGANSVLNTAVGAAGKTGTTNDFRDNWTMGFTPDLAVGVWVGNPDYTEMRDTTGLSGAAPIWAEFINSAVYEVVDGNLSYFRRPATIVEKRVCTLSGTEPSEWCPEIRIELFSPEQLPPPAEDDLWQKVLVDTWTELLASPECSEFAKDLLVVNIEDEWGREWVLDTQDGRNWLTKIGFTPDDFNFMPERACTAQDTRPELRFVHPQEGQTITANDFPISVVANADGFVEFSLEWGEGADPKSWQRVDIIARQFTAPHEIAKFEIFGFDDSRNGQTITLRLYLLGSNGRYAETHVTVKLDLPPATATPTSSPTITPTETLTPTTTGTPTITSSPSATTAPPTLTPTPTNTPVPTLAPADMTATISVGLTQTKQAGP